MRLAALEAATGVTAPRRRGRLPPQSPPRLPRNSSRVLASSFHRFLILWCRCEQVFFFVTAELRISKVYDFRITSVPENKMELFFWKQSEFPPSFQARIRRVPSFVYTYKYEFQFILQHYFILFYNFLFSYFFIHIVFAIVPCSVSPANARTQYPDILSFVGARPLIPNWRSIQNPH